MSTKKVIWKFNPKGEGTKTTVERDGGTTRVVKEKANKHFFGIPLSTSLLSEKTIKRRKS